MREARRAVSVGASQGGFTLVELVVGIAILGIGFLALAGATTAGTRLIVQGKQRQAATEEANGRLEHIRNVPYAQVALTTTPAHSADAADPDYYVDPSGPNYDHAHSGTYEPIVIDATAGQVLHLDGTVVVGSTSLSVYQYVTWVDDPGITGTQDYKRVTIAVTYAASSNPGRARSVQVSALLTSGTVSVGGSQSGATQGSGSTPTPSPTPTPTPTAGCSDHDESTFSILSGTGSQVGFTASTSVTISLEPEADACTPVTVELSNDGATWGTPITYDPATPTVSWTLTAGDGSKSVWAKFRNSAGTTHTAGPKTITLDATPPTVPGTLTRTVGCSGSDRTVNLSWGTSSDTNFLGYRVYKNTNNAGFTALLTTATQSGSDTHAKTLNSVDFKVVAYDKAGNEGNATNVISLAKNVCS